MHGRCQLIFLFFFSWWNIWTTVSYILVCCVKRCTNETYQKEMQYSVTVSWKPVMHHIDGKIPVKSPMGNCYGDDAWKLSIIMISMFCEICLSFCFFIVKRNIPWTTINCIWDKIMLYLKKVKCSGDHENT